MNARWNDRVDTRYAERQPGGGSFGRNRCAFIPHTTPLKYMAFIEPTIYSHNTQNNTDFAVTLIDSMRHSWYMWSVWNEDIL